MSSWTKVANTSPLGQSRFSPCSSQPSAQAVGLMCRARSAFEVFDDSNWDLTQFIEIRVFHRCDQFLVPRPCGIEHELAWPDIQRPWSSMVIGYWVPPDTRLFLRSRQAKCSLVALWLCGAWPDYSRMRSCVTWGFKRWTSHVSLPVCFRLSVWAVRWCSHLARPCEVFHS
jgi:hypothetical protein